jgi:hypothetical protein
MKDFAADWYPNFLTDQEFPGQPGMTAIVFILRGKC